MGGDNANRQANFLLAHLSVLFNHLQIFILVIIDNHFLRLFGALVSDPEGRDSSHLSSQPPFYFTVFHNGLVLGRCYSRDRPCPHWTSACPRERRQGASSTLISSTIRLLR